MNHLGLAIVCPGPKATLETDTVLHVDVGPSPHSFPHGGLYMGVTGLLVDVPQLWTRRRWLVRHVAVALAATPVSRFSGRRPQSVAHAVTGDRSRSVSASVSEPMEDSEALAKHAVDAAQRAGAQYADARLTRMEHHIYHLGELNLEEIEEVGIGVRALVNGYWGFAASPSGDTIAVERLARQAVAQAVVNARGALPRTVELGRIPAAVGRWATPVVIDPFTVPIEEKLAFIRYWVACADKAGMRIDTLSSFIQFTRQERVVATSDGGCFTQTIIESGGHIVTGFAGGAELRLAVQGIEIAGRGWELFLDAKIPEQVRLWPMQGNAVSALVGKIRPAAIGRYTVVCDGLTMAALLEATLGVATQLDRALGYEANAGGTSFLDDPVAMLGSFKVGSPLVNVTANRSAPTQLATIKWDDEGVEPPVVQLVKDGVLVDFQTTREQAAWLAPYYAKVGRPIHSNGCAAAESALGITMQHMPNLALEPGHSDVRIEDLVANVKDGVLLEQGRVLEIDAQARNGLLYGASLRQISNGRLGPLLRDGAIAFNTLELWRNIIAVGGLSTRAVMPSSQYPFGGETGQLLHLPVKGQPAQATSHSVQAVAATIANQPLINPLSKA